MFYSHFRHPFITALEVSYPLKECDNTFRPRMDLFETKEDNTVTAAFELPGLTSEDVAIDVQQNRLTISGDGTGVRTPAQEEGYVVHERQLGKFTRTLKLPFGTKVEDVKARMEHGVLTVTYPRVNPGQQPHRISVQTA